MVSKKVITILLLFSFLGVFLGFYYLGASKIGVGSENSEKTTKLEEINIKNCYLVQTDFKSYRTSITSEELKDTQVYTNSQEIRRLNDLGFQYVEGVEELNDAYLYYQGLNKQTFLVIPLGMSDYRLKTLKVDDREFWQQEQYPLCLEEKLQVELSGKESILANYHLFEGSYYNYNPEDINSIFIGGEIIPARAVDRTWLNLSNNYTLLFDRLRDRIENSDLAIAMLENPLRGDPEPCRGCMMFVGDARNAQGFREVGFDAFGVGNHFGDGGQSGIESTLKLLEDLDIGLAGASNSTLDAASRPYVMQMGNYKVALLSAEDVAAYYWFEGSYGTNYYSKKASTGGVGMIDKDKISSDIAKAGELADIVIVMMSWGSEYTNHSNAHQQALAHAIVDAGADMIVGSHPHWVQEIEVYKGKPIVYSLGNFIFDQTDEGLNVHWSRHNGETRQGMTMMAYYYQGELKSIEMIPHIMCGYNQVGGESYNKSRNLAWGIQEGTMTYEEVDKIDESKGCVWYQPTPIKESHKVYKFLWDRVMEFTNL